MASNKAYSISAEHAIYALVLFGKFAVIQFADINVAVISSHQVFFWSLARDQAGCFSQGRATQIA